MHLVDWSIVAVYLAYVIWDGTRRVKGTGELEGYFLANRSMPWWAVGLSVMATQLSAITLVGTTGQAYADGMRFLQFYYGLPLAMVILCVTVVPFFHRAKVYTAYEYLERRFDAKTRSLTSFFFLVSRGMAVGVIIAAPSVVLSIVLGWNEWLTIFAIGLSTTFYTMVGGVQAVTWTDVKQMVLIFFAMSMVLGIIIGALPEGVTLGDALHLAGAAGHLETVNTSLDLSDQYTIWSGLIGGLFLMLAYFGTDQSQVQRYLTARSIGQARTSLLMSAYVKIPMQFAILLIGVLVFIFYHFQRAPLVFHPVEAQRVERSERAAEWQELASQYEDAQQQREQSALAYMQARRAGEHPHGEWEAYAAASQQVETIRDNAVGMVRQLRAGEDEAARRWTFFGREVRLPQAPWSDVNYVFPSFILQNMPIGVIGLMIAAIFAAAMSSVSSELNALATATVIDFYRRHFKPDATDRHYVFAGRVATGIWGFFACVVALYATHLGSLIVVVNRFGSYFYGSLLGVFVLAMLLPRARARGAFWGLLAGVVSVGLVNYHTNIAFLWFNVIGCAVVVAVGYLLSLTDRRPAVAHT